MVGGAEEWGKYFGEPMASCQPTVEQWEQISCLCKISPADNMQAILDNGALTRTAHDAPPGITGAVSIIFGKDCASKAYVSKNARREKYACLVNGKRNQMRACGGRARACTSCSWMSLGSG
jgi:hypothetical protein